MELPPWASTPITPPLAARNKIFKPAPFFNKESPYPLKEARVSLQIHLQGELSMVC